MAEVITVANHKGGCAKTVTTLNLGYALKELGYKVASVSLDYWNNSRYRRIDKCIKFALYFTL